MKVRIFPPDDMIDGAVELPVSKSVANRRMIIDAIAGSEMPQLPPEGCGTDIVTLRSALLNRDAAAINVGPAGTAMRFMTAYLAAQPGRPATLLDGDARMRQRPIGQLVDALRQLGAEIEYAGVEGFPPLKIHGRKLRGGQVKINADVSSQFISALMMIAPTMEQGLKIDLEGVVKSESYIKLTVAMMTARGIDAEYDRGDRTVTIKPGTYTPDNGAPVERDWSAMAFWTELTAVTAGFITVNGLDRESAQGDRAVMEVFGELGCREAEPDDDDEDDGDDDSRVDRAPGAIELCGSPDLAGRFIYDFSSNPDLAQPAIVTCCLTSIPFKATGLETLVRKETDRVTALIEELAKIGCVLTREAEGVLSWNGARKPVFSLPEFDARGDHRMAMSLAPVAAFIPGITIDGAECVGKSYPTYWQQLSGLGFKLLDGNLSLDNQQSAE